MKAQTTVLPKTDRQTGLILLFAEKSIPRVSYTRRNHDERKQTGILTSGFNPYSRLPEPELCQNGFSGIGSL